MKLRWYFRSAVNERMCYKSCAVMYHSLATGSLDFHPEDQRGFLRAGHLNILKCL